MLSHLIVEAVIADIKHGDEAGAARVVGALLLASDIPRGFKKVNRVIECAESARMADERVPLRSRHA